MEGQFIKDPGLFVLTIALIIVTALYTYATMKRWKIMKIEYEFKTKPKLGFKSILINQNDWDSVKIEQDVVNIGIGYTTIVIAKMKWSSTTADREMNVQCTEKTPIIFAPGATIRFSFEIKSVELNNIKASDVKMPSFLLKGKIEYQCKGLDDKEYSFINNIPFQQFT